MRGIILPPRSRRRCEGILFQWGPDLYRGDGYNPPLKLQSDLPHGVVHNRQILLSKHHKMGLAKTQTLNQIKPLSDDPSRFDCNSTSNWFASSNGIVSEHYYGDLFSLLFFLFWPEEI